MLRPIALGHDFRIKADLEGFPFIPGRRGRIECYDRWELAVWTDRPRLFAKLWAIPGVRRWQVGDQEARGLFPVEALPAVAAVVRARRRRTLSTEAARRRSGLATVRATSAVQEFV
jgi:hypothetical protein